MGVFDDKKFEQLDWMSQITETIDSELNGLLARLPDEKTFDMQSLLASSDNSYGLSISSGNLVRQMLKDLGSNLEYTEENRIAECFKFEGSDKVQINFETGLLVGELRLVKVTKTLEDEDLQKMMGYKGLESFKNTNYDDSMCARANEILDLIEAPKEGMRTRTIRKKVRAIREHLKDVLLNNKWRIRDMELANKVSIWAKDYITKGNLAPFVNLTKLKVMSYNDMPIYSIEEEK